MKYVRTVVSTQSGGEPPFLTSEMFDVVRSLMIERPSSENSISQLKQLGVRKAGLPPLLVSLLDLFFRSRLALKHLEHAIGNHKSANDVGSGTKHGGETENSADRVVVCARSNKRAYE